MLKNFFAISKFAKEEIRLMVCRFYNLFENNKITGDYSISRFILVNVKLGLRYDICKAQCTVKNNEMELDDIFTVADYQNRGLASFLLQHIITYARYSGLKTIKGTLQHGNEKTMAKLRKFYIKNGFTCSKHYFFINLQKPTKGEE